MKEHVSLGAIITVRKEQVLFAKVPKRSGGMISIGPPTRDHPDFTQELPRKLLPARAKEAQSRPRNKR